MIDLEFKKSQLNQDLWILDLYKMKKDGYFVEVGACDGTNLSNTYLLEKCFDWKGICIEPVPSSWQSLVQNRECIALNECVSDTSGHEVSFMVQSCYSGITGLTEKKDYPNEDGVVDYKESLTLKTKTLADIFIENDVPEFIDYVSIDTEGSELNVLKGVDFDSLPTIGAFTIEHNYETERRNDIKSFLESKNYRRAAEYYWDDFYVLNNIDDYIEIK
tara:strand:+ start:809 stop:1462 length:654 start_codon:yes stop_codon:yes gene_type:complete